MSLVERIRRLLARNEVDDINRSAGQMVGLLDERRETAERIKDLRRADPVPVDLGDAIKRRNAVRGS